MNERKLLEAYTRLVSFKNNIPIKGNFPEKYVTEYHDILHLLENTTGQDLAGFVVPDTEIKPRLSKISRIHGEKSYTSGRYCDRSVLLMKVDAVLLFFEIQTQPVKPSIGFKLPK